MANFGTGGVFDPTRDYQISGTLQGGSILPSVALGYAPASVAVGGTVTQATNRTTGVTLNTICGAITTNSASLAAEAAAEFTVTNAAVGLTDVVVLSQRSGANGGSTNVYVSTVAAGSFKITVMNNNASGGTAETGAIIINFLILKSVAT